MADIQLGAAYTFVPTAFIDAAPGQLAPGRSSKQKDTPRRVTGRITYINLAHRFFVATFEVNGCTLNESFKF